MSFGFLGPELMATLFQPNPRSEVLMKDANKQAFKYRNLEHAKGVSFGKKIGDRAPITPIVRPEQPFEIDRTYLISICIRKQVVFLIPDSSNKIYVRWTGPGEIIQHPPPHSYKVKLHDGTVRHVHVNKIRKYHPRALAVGVIFESDHEFGEIHPTPNLSRSTSERILHETDLNHLKDKSDAEIAYLFVCVNKKDGTLRHCVDFRALNSESVSDDFPMEDAVELIHSIGRTNIITTFDLLKGYWAIPVAEDSKNLASFMTNRQQYRFKALVKAPSLYSPVPDKPFTIHLDALQIGIAAFLSQKCGDKGYPIAYASQKLSKTQLSGSTIEQETFAIVWSLKQFEVWVFGTGIEFYTDHNTLPYLTKSASQSDFWHMTAAAGSDVVQSGCPICNDFFQHLWPYIGNNTANVVFQMVKRLWLIRLDQ
ncbi:retrovirus-related Pol polyprotein from transposon 17.6 [Trichonephila clavipes]|nr:retrovirus-related Pol polyprotein from transposon 17.6 [Trichonephila clavipes]